MSIWFRTPDLDTLNDSNKDTINERLGIRFTKVDEGSISATMPVDARTHQPFGILHGGASVVLAETLGSVSANFCLNPETHYAVGLDINANHLRSVSNGLVTGTARPVHLGRSTHVWSIELQDEQGRPTCISRLTMALLERPQQWNPT